MAEPWTIRGVPEETRRKAKAAAAECGVSLGKWLTVAIGALAPVGNHGFRVVVSERGSATIEPESATDLEIVEYLGNAELDSAPTEK